MLNSKNMKTSRHLFPKRWATPRPVPQNF